MLKKFRFAKSNLVILLAYIFALVSWGLLDRYFFNSLFLGLATDKVTDLSKTLIQSTGILVGLVVAAGFFYISRMDEIGISILSRAYRLLEKIEMAIMERKKTAKLLEECKIHLTSLSSRLKNSDVVRKAPLKEKLNELEKAFEETDQMLKALENSDVRPLLGKYHGVEKLGVAVFAFDVALFLASIIVAITSYVSLSGLLLGVSFDLLYFGIALLFMVWEVFYQMSAIARDLFEIVLEFKAKLRMTTIRNRELRNRRDELVNEIKEACAKAKS